MVTAPYSLRPPFGVLHTGCSYTHYHSVLFLWHDEVHFLNRILEIMLTQMKMECSLDHYSAASLVCVTTIEPKADFLLLKYVLEIFA